MKKPHAMKKKIADLEVQVQSQQEKTWYKCDPEKNKKCAKTSCIYNPNAIYKVCDRTSNPLYAVDEM